MLRKALRACDQISAHAADSPAGAAEAASEVHVDIPQESGYSHVAMPHESRIELLQGTLDVMVLRTLQAIGPQHGYGIARRIEQISGDTVLLNQGTIYAALVRLQQRGLISAEWGTSDNNRKAKYYVLTRRGRRHLEAETKNWHKLASVMGRVLSQLGGHS
jgi:transcriptional regulator